MSTKFYKDLKKNKARDLIEIFERGIRLLIEEELKNYYNENWWENGIPQPIRDRVSYQLNNKKKRKPKKIYKKIDELTFNDYESIIFNRKNWNIIFKNTFIEKFNIRYPLQQLRHLRNELFHGRRLSDKDYRKIQTYIEEIFEYIPTEITTEDLIDINKQRREMTEAYVSHFQESIEKMKTQRKAKPLVIPSFKEEGEISPTIKEPLEHKPQEVPSILKTTQKTAPIITTDRILNVLTDEWQTIKHLIFKLKIRDMMDARYLQLKLKELERKKRVDVVVKMGRKYWKLK